ncbi:hypothetical protein RB213_012404 [Colletotrichum asianum]
MVGLFADRPVGGMLCMENGWLVGVGQEEGLLHNPDLRGRRTNNVRRGAWREPWEPTTFGHTA